MDNKILTFIPKMYFPSAIFLGGKSPVFLKIIKKEKKIVLVSKSFKKTNSEALRELFGSEAEYFVHSGEPQEKDFKELKERCALARPSYIIAIGGGSIIDLAKLVKAELKIKMAAVPTTVGSGAEVSRHALLICGENKKVFSGAELLPETVILNPLYLKSLSRKQILLQSVDALSHALESLVSKMSNNLSDNFALMAIENIYCNLKELADKEADDKILGELQIAAIFSGLAQSSAGTGLAHAFAHYFGAKSRISHAEAVSMFLLDVLELNVSHITAYQKLNSLKNISSDNFIGNLRNLFQDLKLNFGKMELKNNLDEIADAVKKDICALTNPYQARKEEIIEIVKRKI